MISLKWFKGAIERTIERVVENKIEQAFNELDSEGGQVPSSNYSTTSPCTTSYVQKPYVNIKMVNDTLTVVLLDGNILTKCPASTNDFNAAREAQSEKWLLDIMCSPEIVAERRAQEAAIERQKAIVEGAKTLAKHADFEMKDGAVYIKGINRSLPDILVEEFLAVLGRDPYGLSDEYQSLKRFFMWCCLNPRAEVAHELYRFLKENSFRITKQGFFVALRNVVTLHGSNELVHFVSNAYNKVKAVWKKRPDDYTVFLENGEYKMVQNDSLTKRVPCTYCDGTGSVPYNENDGDYWYEDSDECPECDGEGYVTDYINHGEKIGNLTELYLDLPNRSENRFTDDWTKTFDIRIGKPVSMPMEKCNWSTQDCAAAGLHFTSDQIHYVGCGDTSVLVLINPMKVVGIGQHKGRCYEYLPIMTVPRDEATEILHDFEFDTLELDDAYAIRELESLEEKVKEGFTAESKKYAFNMPAINIVDIKNIVASLDEMKKELSNRVIIVE